MPYIYLIFVIQILCYLLSYHAAEDVVGSRLQNITMLHTDGDEKGLQLFTIKFDLSTLILVQLDQHQLKIGRTAKSFQDKP